MFTTANKKKHIFPTIIAIIAFAIVLACVGYVNDYYRSEVEIEEYAGQGRVSISEVDQGLFLDGNGDKNAIIFYPGAKVEYTSYLPLFYQLAEQGIDCFLVEMPCNLAIFGMNKAEDIMEEYDYENWYLSGHSLGGAMAASYAAEHIEELEGLILLAAYPTKELISDDLSVLSLYGSEDMVLNMEKLEEGRKYMPENYMESCIEGGNHAWFGNYGEQEGDGIASITREEQQKKTADAILEMLYFRTISE